MAAPRSTAGLLVAVAAGLTFGASGAVIKPLLETGWSPAAAVTMRALIGGVVLAPIAVLALRGRWSSLWRARWRVLGMAVIGVAGTQLAYFAAVQRIHVGTAILIEYLAPIALVGVVWARTRHVPRPVVLIGSVVAIGGLVLVVGPSAFAGGDLLGIVFALIAMVGCAAYFIIAARPSHGLPPVALAAAGLLIGSGVLAGVGASGLVPFTFSAAPVVLIGAAVPWYVPLLIVGIVATAIAYVASISASEMLGSRLASFLGLLEVVFATLYAWLLLGESLTPVQLGGGVLILAGIALVRSDRSADALPEEVAATSPAREPARVGQNGADGLPGEPSPRDAGLPAR